ncbi:hypothetical protein TNIN_147891 [Trichonephila inaurata madagascariensis]|uniref:Uncharacterized protein n=1 Tax=Trichonephila inaurata madagascariensis TaxID=2747483 RepID=A0A8X7CLR4_9ARAC|nr:hypothetical protein TNIN_147891 [Trichonephila inaurata madagascariensis]
MTAIHLQNHWFKFPTLKTCPQRYLVAISYSNINGSTLLITATNRLVHIKSPHKSRPLNALNGLCPSYLNTPQQTSTSLISHSRISERMNSISRNPGWGKRECTYNKCRERCIVTGGCDVRMTCDYDAWTVGSRLERTHVHFPLS